MAATSTPTMSSWDAWLRAVAEEARNFPNHTDRARAVQLSATDYLLEFDCRGLAKEQDGQIVEVDHHIVGVRFGRRYWERPLPEETLIVVAPGNAFNPNLAPPFACITLDVKPRLTLLGLAVALYDVLGWRSINTASPLNPDAARFAIAHPERWPVEIRPFGRRKIQLQIEEVQA